MSRLSAFISRDRRQPGPCALHGRCAVRGAQPLTGSLVDGSTRPGDGDVCRSDVITSVRYGFEGASIVLTCAATMRQPWGNRTQVCIVRPTFPDCGRPDRVDTVAKSLP